MSNTASATRIIVGLPFQKDISTLDPSRVQTLSQAILLRNLYSSLFEYDDDGNLVIGSASNFRWENNELIISFDDRPIISTGRSLNALDAFDSLRRLIALDTNSHGNLADLICREAAAPDGTCDGMRVEGNELRLRAISKRAAQQLIPTLATVDFRILPREVIEWSDRNLRITRYDITSGAYIVTKSDLLGNLTLKANKGFYRYSQEMPQTIEIKGQGYRQSVDDFSSSKIDLLTTAIPVTADDLSKFQQAINDLQIAKTYDIRIKILYFGASAIRDFTSAQRFSIAKIVKQRFDKIALPFEHETNQFFQEFASGYLTPDQSREITKLRNQPVIRDFARKVQLGLSSGAKERWRDFFEANPEFSGRYQDDTYFQTPPDSRPDIYSGANDVAFDRSSSVISYNVNLGIFGPNNDESRRWLKLYSGAYTDEEQIKLLNLKHFDALKECFMYPLGASPYLIMSRNGWRSGINPYFSSTELWRIRRT